MIFLRFARVMAVMAGVAIAVWLAIAVPQVYAIRRYNLASARINQKIVALELRRPSDVPAEVWQASVAWTSIAICNICFSERHAPYAELLRYERELDERLEGPVDLRLLEWARLRLAETGPHGRRYVERWRPDWDASIGQDIHADRNESDPR